MTGFLSDNQINQSQSTPLTRAQKLYILTTLVIITIISYLPVLIGNLVFEDEGISTNAVVDVLILPFLSLTLMIIFPICVAKIKPELAGFDMTWIQKKRSEIAWIFLLPLVTLVSGGTIRLLIEQLGLSIANPTLFFSTSALFFYTYTLRLAFVGPIVEEIFWRGYAQDRLGRVFGPRIAMFTQAIAFASLHFRPIGGFFQVFVYGLIFGLWRHRRKTLLPIIITHIIINSVVCAGYWSNWAELIKINTKTNYLAQFNKISKPANYDPNDNAAPYYQKAFELCVEQPEQISKSDIKIWPKDLPEDNQILLQNWVSANSKALEQLELGTRKPYYWLEYQGSSMWDIALPPLKKTNSLTCALCSRAKLNATRGNLEAAFSDLLVCYRFGMHLTGPKTLIKQLAGISISTIAVLNGLEILDKTKPNPDLLKDFQSQLELLSDKQSYAIDFTAEKFIVHDIIQMTFTDDGKGGGYVPKVGIDQIINPPEPLKFLFSDLTEEQKRGWEKLERRQTTELTDEIFEYFNQVRHKTPAQLHNEGKDLEKVIEEMTKDNPFLNLLMPPFGRAINISFRCQAETDALITTLALLRYKAEKGQLPENLDRLVTIGYLKELPVDPYSDNPLVYKQISDDFILYSFGADFDDDGGTPSKWGEGEQGGDQVFWPVEPK